MDPNTVIQDLARSNNFGARSFTMMDQIVNAQGLMLENTPRVENNIQNPNQTPNLEFNFNESLANHNWQSQIKDAHLLMN